MQTPNPCLMNEKYKEVFTTFLVKVLNITGYNLMTVPVYDDDYGCIGMVIFVNKHVDKDRRNFDKRDEKLSNLVSNITKIFFKVKDSELSTKSIEDKNWKMSELVDLALASQNVKVIFRLTNRNTYPSSNQKLQISTKSKG
jgi:hypothetical protein